MKKLFARNKDASNDQAFEELVLIHNNVSFTLLSCCWVQRAAYQISKKE